MTVGNLYHSLKRCLSEKYSPSESKEMVLLIFEALKNWTLTDILIRQEEEISEYISDKSYRIADRILKGEPIQYIVGMAHFYGMKFKVDRNTLIPRPETSELVDIIVSNNSDRKDLRVLDIGTGSGCISIALARNLKFPKITAVDISDGALKVAEENARNLKADVKFIKGDILRLPAPSGNYDIIVSNPPYVMMSEAEKMDVNVLDYEPATALFVPDIEPLLFYLPIIEYAAAYLNPEGQLYFEINPLCSEILKKAVSDKGFGYIEIIKDISGKDRFIYAIK